MNRSTNVSKSKSQSVPPVVPAVDPALVAAVAATLQVMQASGQFNVFQGVAAAPPIPSVPSIAAPKLTGQKKQQQKKQAAPRSVAGKEELVLTPYFHANEGESRLAILAPVGRGKALVPSHLTEAHHQNGKVLTLERFRKNSVWYLNIRPLVVVNGVQALGLRLIDNVVVTNANMNAEFARVKKMM